MIMIGILRNRYLWILFLTIIPFFIARPMIGTDDALTIGGLCLTFAICLFTTLSNRNKYQLHDYDFDDDSDN